MGYQVVQQDIRAAAKQLDMAGEGVKGADPSGDLSGIKTAMPSSQSASAAESLSTAWRGRFTGWGNDATGQHRAMNASADSYDAADHAAALEQQQIQNRLEYGF